MLVLWGSWPAGLQKVGGHTRSYTWGFPPLLWSEQLLKDPSCWSNAKHPRKKKKSNSVSCIFIYVLCLQMYQFVIHTNLFGAMLNTPPKKNKKKTADSVKLHFFLCLMPTNVPVCYSYKSVSQIDKYTEHQFILVWLYSVVFNQHLWNKKWTIVDWTCHK